MSQIHSRRVLDYNFQFKYMMAEVLAIIASAASICRFAVQLAEGARKLQELYSMTRNADNEVLRLSRDITSYTHALNAIINLTENMSLPKSLGLGECLSSCKVLVEKLQNLIEELDLQIKKCPFRGKIKFLFRRDSVKDLRDALSSAQSPLTLLLISHTRSGLICSRVVNNSLIWSAHSTLENSMNFDHKYTASSRNFDPSRR